MMNFEGKMGRADPAQSADFGPEGGGGRAPRRIRQSRSCHRREQSFAHSGVLHALLPPAGDGALLHVGRSSSSSPTPGRAGPPRPADYCPEAEV